MKLLSLAGALLLMAGFFPVLSGAEEPQIPTVKLAEQAGYLTDSEGRSLYIYLRDGKQVSNCYDRCAENWLPLTVDAQPVAGTSVHGWLLGTILREDGSTQVTYNGWPLYYHARDKKPGETAGHRLGNIFYLISPNGVRIEEEITVEAPPEDEAVEREERADATASSGPLISDGRMLFARNCAACHGAEGQGDIGPGFDGNAALERAGYVVSMILNGRPSHGMPAWGDRLTDSEIAAVATYIRNAWSNDFGPVTEEQVSERR